MTVVLGAAIAATVVLAFRLPAWGPGPVAFTVAVWGRATHMSTGYLANELSLVCVVVALFPPCALPGSAGVWRLASGVAAATAAGLAHPGLLPFYVGVGVLWFALSLPRWLRGRGAGSWIWSAGATGFLMVLVLATGVVAVVIFGVMGQRLADVTNLTEKSPTSTRGSPRRSASWVYGCPPSPCWLRSGSWSRGDRGENPRGT